MRHEATHNILTACLYGEPIAVVAWTRRYNRKCLAPAVRARCSPSSGKPMALSKYKKAMSSAEKRPRIHYEYSVSDDSSTSQLSLSRCISRPSSSLSSASWLPPPPPAPAKKFPILVFIAAIVIKSWPAGKENWIMCLSATGMVVVSTTRLATSVKQAITTIIMGLRTALG